MKKSHPYIVCAVLILIAVLITISCVSFWNFLQPGVHGFAGYRRLDLQETVYFVNGDDHTVSGCSTVTISGLIQPTKPNGESRSFRGGMSVAQYPVSIDDSYDSFWASVSDGMIIVTNLHSESKNEAHVEYLLQMSAKNPDIYIIHIYLPDGTTVSAYPGQTEQEAIANCEAYWQWFRTSEK